MHEKVNNEGESDSDFSTNRETQWSEVHTVAV